MGKTDLNVFYFNGVPAQASGRYRVFNALEQLRLADVEATLLPQDFDPARCFGKADGPGVLIVHRVAWDERVAALMQEARSRGWKVLYDIDDLVFEPIAIPWVRGLSRLDGPELELYYDGVRRYHRALRAADGVLTTTRTLAGFASVQGVPAFVHRNALDLRSVDTAKAARQGKRPRRETVIYYGAGTATHDVDFLQCSVALERILREDPSACLLVQGDVDLPFGIQQLGARVRRWPFMPWPDYFWGISQADINIAPLELGNPFCEVKSELKWFEAGALGIPTIASATGSFAEVIDSGKTGYLAKDEPEWYEALQDLIQDSRRTAVGAAAEKQVVANYHPSVMGPRLVDLLTSIVEAPDLNELAAGMPDRASKAEKHEENGAGPKSAQPVAKQARPSISIGWLAPALPRGGGGARNIMRMARHLKSFGHDVTLYFDPLGQFSSQKELAASIDANFPGEKIPVVMGLDKVKPSDALIATLWITAYALREIQHSRQKFYLVQDFEPYFYPMGDDYLRAEATYSFGFYHITSGPWCTKFLKEKYDARADFFDFPLDRSIYYPRPVPHSPRPRILFFSRPEMARRCYKLGVDALARLKARIPDAEIILFGSDEIEINRLPFQCENVGNLGDLDKLAELYSSATAALVLSTTNTSLVPFEVAACGCPVVDIDLDVNRVNYKGQSAMLLAPPDPDAIAEALFTLVDDTDLHERHREAGFRLAEGLPNEEQAARRFEEILLDGLGIQPIQSHSDATTLNGHGGPLDHLALDVTCREEDVEPVRLPKGACVSQSFRAGGPNLAAVAVKVALFGVEQETSLEMSLYEAGREEPVQTIRRSLQDVPDNGWAVFRFHPVTGSEGRDYRFAISAQDLATNRTVALHYTRASIYDEGQLQINERSSKGALVFQTFLEREDVTYLESILQPARARPTGDYSDNGVGSGLALAGGADVYGLRDELRLVRKQLQKIDSRQQDTLPRLMEMHNFFGAVRASLPYRAARKVARTLRISHR
jgi:glycosyltransferase involved in cell wall biosynthesis